MAALSTNDVLQLITGSAVSTDYSVSYSDSPQSNVGDAFSSEGNVATATTTTILGAPGPRVRRSIREVIVRNRHASASQTVTLAKSVSGTAYHLTPAITLFAGESLLWTDTSLDVFTATGRKKTASGSYVTPSIMHPPGFQTNDIASTVPLGTGWCAAQYMGKAPRNLEWATIRLRVTTAVSAGASEWCQVALAKGDVNVGGNPTLTVVGFTSAEGTLNSTGLKSVIVSVGANQGLNEGDNIWAVVGCSAPVILRVRAGLADDLQTGGFAVVSSQPSSILGVATPFTIAAATVSAPWVNVVV